MTICTYSKVAIHSSFRTWCIELLAGTSRWHQSIRNPCHIGSLNIFCNWENPPSPSFDLSHQLHFSLIGWFGIPPRLNDIGRDNDDDWNLNWIANQHCGSPFQLAWTTYQGHIHALRNIDLVLSHEHQTSSLATPSRHSSHDSYPIILTVDMRD